MLNCDDTAVGEAATVPGSVDLVNYRRVHVAAAQEIGMQRMRYSPFHCVLRRGQRLAQYLSSEYLRAANVTAVAAEDILFYPFELEQRYEIGKYRVHGLVDVAAAIDRDTRTADKHGVIAGKEQNDLGDVDRFAYPAGSG